MTKKFLSVLLIVAVAALSFSVVSAQDDMMMECPEGEATITIAGGAVGSELEVGEEAAAIYMEACPNITVEFVPQPDSATDRLQAYQNFWAQESGDIDLYQVDVIWAGIIAEHMVDLNEYLDEEFIGQFFEGMIEGQTIDGRLVALPWFTDAAGLYYRTDLLEEYDLEVPTTWDELEAAAQTIQDGVRAETGNDDFWGYVWQGNAYEGLTCDAHEWVASTIGSTFITPEGEITVNQEAVIEIIDQAAGWVGTISPPGVTGYDEEGSRAVWQNGDAAFMRNWPYAYGLGNGEDSVIAGNFGYAPLPAGASGEAAACLGGWQLGVSAYSENIEAAVSVAQFLAGYEGQKLRALSTFGANPTIPALYEDEELLAENELFGLLGPILASAVARPSGITGASYNDASELFYQAVHSVLTGDATAAEAMDNLELDLEDFLIEIGVN